MAKQKEMTSDVAQAITDLVRDAETKSRTKKVDVVEVRKYPGQKIEYPESMSIPAVISVLEREFVMQEETVHIIEEVDCFPWDGAYALQFVLEEMFGVVFAEATPSWFGKNPPRELSVEVDFGVVAKVRWGRFRIPGTSNLDGDTNWLETGSSTNNKGQPTLMISAYVQRKYEHIVRSIAARVRQRVQTHSIYRGKAFRMGNLLSDAQPNITFLDLSKTKPEEMVFSAELEHLIAVNLWTPIRHSGLVAKLRTPLKRGILLAGPYGTGKTLLAYVTAAIAVVAGWTFIYLEDVDQLPYAIQWAKQFGKVVIFAEDLDRADNSDSNELPNTLDGLDTKDSEVMVVLTTNHIDAVSQLLLRPGRLDCILPIDPPDAAAHVRLIEVYGRGMLADGEDFTEVAKELADQKVIPAVTREVVERAKLAYIERAPEKAELGLVELTAEDLLWSVRTMQAQSKLLLPAVPTEHTPAEQFGAALGKQVAKGLGAASQRVAIATADAVKEALM